MCAICVIALLLSKPLSFAHIRVLFFISSCACKCWQSIKLKFSTITPCWDSNLIDNNTLPPATLHTFTLTQTSSFGVRHSVCVFYCIIIPIKLNIWDVSIKLVTRWIIGLSLFYGCALACLDMFYHVYSHFTWTQSEGPCVLLK